MYFCEGRAKERTEDDAVSDSSACEVVDGFTYLRVLEILEKSVLAPGDTLVDVSLGVREAVDGSGLTAEETVKVGTD